MWDHQYPIFTDDQCSVGRPLSFSAQFCKAHQCCLRFQQIPPILLNLPLRGWPGGRGHFEQSCCQKSNHCPTCGFNFYISHFGMPLSCNSGNNGSVVRWEDYYQTRWEDYYLTQSLQQTNRSPWHPTNNPLWGRGLCPGILVHMIVKFVTNKVIEFFLIHRFLLLRMMKHNKSLDVNCS